ncbi:hypothetical protein NE538_27905, partial [Enterocloster bolteae]|nr:hypothetical protein [Enterocloster bolteae]
NITKGLNPPSLSIINTTPFGVPAPVAGPRKENKIINNIYIYINDKQEAIWGPLIIIIFNNNRDPPSININIKIIYKYLNNILLYK